MIENNIKKEEYENHITSVTRFLNGNDTELLDILKNKIITPNYSLGVFLKNDPYGLKHAKIPLKNKREKLKTAVVDFLSSVLDGEIDIVSLYEEANEYGYKRYYI